VRKMKKQNQNNMESTLGGRIRMLREQARLKQEELAEKLFLANKAEVSRYENGQRIPTIQQLSRLSELFDVPISFLLGEDEGLDPLEAQALSLFRKFRTEEARQAVISMWKNALIIAEK